ncbi:MAG: DUF188 domain-containing protein [Thermomicrobiales bacterium]
MKDEVYKVAARYGLKIWVVSNAFMQIPASPLIARMIVDAGPDVADDWIAEHVAPGDIAVTNDIPLAERVLQAGGHAAVGQRRALHRELDRLGHRPARPNGAAPLHRRIHRRTQALRPQRPLALPAGARRDHPEGAPAAALSARPCIARSLV